MHPFFIYLLSVGLALIEHKGRNHTADRSHNGNDDQEVDPRHGRAEHLPIARRVGFGDEPHHRIALCRERVDNGVNSVHQNHGGNHREGDFPEGFPRGGAVNLAGLIDGGRNGLQRRQEDQHLHAGAVDDIVDVVDHVHHIFHDSRADLHVCKQPLQVHGGDKLVGNAASAAVVNARGILHALAQNVHGLNVLHDTGGQDNRDEEDGTEHTASHHFLVEHHGHKQREDDDGRNVEQQLSQTRYQGLREIRVDKQGFPVVLPPYKLQGVTTPGIAGDDFVEADFLASLYEKAKESNSDIVISNYNFVKNGKKKKAFIKLKSKLKYSDSKKWAKKIYEDIKIRGYVWNKLYKRELIVKNRIKFPNTGEIIEDQSFNFLAFLNANKVSVQDKYLYNYVFRDNSVLHKDPMLFVNKYIRTLALLRYYSLKSDILKTTNVIFFFKKIMMLVYILQNKKYLNGSAFSYIKKIFKQISDIKKCSFSEFLSDEIFEKNYQILRGE